LTSVVVARALVAAAALLMPAAAALAADPERTSVDSRAAARASAAGEGARERLRERLGRFGVLTLDDRTGTVRSLGRLDGFLTGPSDRDGADVALGYAREHAQALGLDGDDLDGLLLVRREVAGGVERLAWEQRYRGIPVADAGLRAAVTRSGRLLALTGPPAADLAVRSVEPRLRAAAAFEAARRGTGAPFAAPVARRGTGAPSAAPAVTAASSGPEHETSFADGGRASLALYRSGSRFRLGWRVLAPVSSTAVYDVLVDAATGAVVRRANRVDFANAKVFRYTPATAAQIDTDFSGWLSTTAALSGPNAHAFADVHDVVPFRPGSDAYDLAPEPGSEIAGENFNFPLMTVPNHGGDNCPGTAMTPPTTACTWNPLQAFSWQTNREQSVTQLFYLVNRFHDHLRTDPDIAFEGGGFRSTGRPLGDPNQAASAAASDPVLAQTLDGADTAAGLPDADHRNSASFLTLPDGVPGLLQTHLWMPGGGTPFGGYDGSNDASMVFHELTHGLSNRLVTDSAGYGALNGAQAGAIGEGVSDFYALDLLEEEGDEVDQPDVPDVRLAGYLDQSAAGAVRWQPIDCEPAHDPVAGCLDVGTDDPPGARAGGLTYADFGRIENGPEVHSDGEIWAQTLWSIRSALIAAHGRADGIARARRYVTGALRIAPPEPSFLDLRNAILQLSPDTDDARLWRVFADRAMGYFAGSEGSDDAAPAADFTDPADLTATGSINGTVVDQDERPLAGATVGIAGFDTGLGPQHTAQSGPDGRYAIAAVPTDGTSKYPAVRARKGGYAGDSKQGVAVAPGGTTIAFKLVRDWSSTQGDAPLAAVRSFTGPDNSSLGCGPGGLVDDDPGTVWGTSRSDGGQSIVVELRAPVDVERVAIDPAAGCGDDDTAALGAYEVQVASVPGGAFQRLGAGAFGPGDGGALQPAFTGATPAVRYLKLLARAPQSSAAGSDGEEYVDVAELHVAKVPGSPIGAAADTGAAQGVGSSGATLTGSVVPHGGPAQVIFEYGTTTAYGSAVAAGSTPAGESFAPFAAAVSGLAALTTYHFRIVALRDGRRYEGGDSAFTTGALPAAPQPPASGAALARIRGRRLVADRSGRFKVRVAFTAAAPSGTAGIAVLRKGRRLAAKRFAVQRARTVTVRLRLSRAGRRTIEPGRSKRVRVQLRLPGGGKVARTLRLARRR